MSPVPSSPKIYHITHVENLYRIVQRGYLLSDARCRAEGIGTPPVGVRKIKRRRLEEIEVNCYSGTMVGDYVPFYFCPRSIMLYLLHMGNHPDLDYHEGQGPIVHLQADLRRSVEWAEHNNQKWTFTDCNAGSYLTSFYNSLGQLNEVNWEAVSATSWSDTLIKEGKQAEFLMFDSFPWKLVDKIGAVNNRTLDRINHILKKSDHKPLAKLERNWYY